MSLNRVVLHGRIVTDPELRTTQNGISFTTIRIAVERNHKNADGEKLTDFFTCTAWRSTAEFVEKYFHKGEQILVDGKLQNNEFTDRDGNKRVATQIAIDSVFFCGGRNNSGKAGQSGHSEQRDNSYDLSAAGANQFEDITGDDSDNDLPF